MHQNKLDRIEAILKRIEYKLDVLINANSGTRCEAFRQMVAELKETAEQMSVEHPDGICMDGALELAEMVGVRHVEIALRNGAKVTPIGSVHGRTFYKVER